MDAAHRDEGGNAVPHLICRASACLCAFPLASVAETMRPLPTEPLPQAPAFVRGVSVIRGAPVPVVDAAELLGAGAAVAQRYVTLKLGVRRVALAVEEVLGVRALPAATLADVPPLLRRSDADTVAAIATLDDQLLLVLRSARLIPETVWQALDAAEPAA
jgi:purine-binding chemotaxis protein CheW